MSFRLRLTIRNTQRLQKDFVIYGGAVFEVTDAFNRRQNLVVPHDVPVSIPGDQSQVVEIDTWCFNRTWAPPDNTPMRPTSLVTSERHRSQDGIWEAMERHRLALADVEEPDDA